MKKPLTRDELQDLHSVLRRAAERAERRKAFDEADRLAKEVAEIAEELRAG